MMVKNLEARMIAWHLTSLYLMTSIPRGATMQRYNGGKKLQQLTGTCFDI
jgi:hypothetical protein